MEQSIEDFRAGLINQNPDVTDTKTITITEAINDAYESLNLLTDILAIELEQSSCIDCSKLLASVFAEMRVAFNLVEELKEAELFSETNTD